MEFFQDIQAKEGYFFANNEIPPEIASISESVVTVDCDVQQIGTGFFVRSHSGNSYLLSAEHCFRPIDNGPKERKVTFLSGIEIPVTPSAQIELPPELLADELSSGDLIVHRLDLAESLDLPVLATSDPTKEDVRNKAPFLLIGYPTEYMRIMGDLRTPFTSVGTITNLFRFFPDEIRTTARAAPGMSGCPMINRGREVVAFLTGCDFPLNTNPVKDGSFAKRLHKVSTVLSTTSILNKYDILK